MYEPYQLVPTTKAVAAILHVEHALRAFGTYSNPTGGCPLGDGQPEMMTMWGIEGTDQPILKSVTKWKLDTTVEPKIRYQRIDETTSHWLCVPTEQDND